MDKCWQTRAEVMRTGELNLSFDLRINLETGTGSGSAHDPVHPDWNIHFGCWCLALSLSQTALAQPFAIDWFTIDGGGGTSTPQAVPDNGSTRFVIVNRPDGHRY